jgi:glutamate-ammonia-ligase adenylyltransferase
LKQAYCAYRDFGHHQVLQDHPALADANQFAELREQVQRIWHTFMN